MTHREATREGLAWRKLQEPALRGVYEHRESWTKRNRRRRNFVRRINRTPGGCWIWTGATRRAPKGGTLHPIYHVKKPMQRSGAAHMAFSWMVSEWFGGSRPRQTAPKCGNSLCINPYHRTNSARSRSRKFTDQQILAIYNRRESGKVTAVAKELGISISTVSEIWRGKRWANVTGHRS